MKNGNLAHRISLINSITVCILTVKKFKLLSTNTLYAKHLGPSTGKDGNKSFQISSQQHYAYYHDAATNNAKIIQQRLRISLAAATI